jgi:hypothetical protein
MGESLAFLIRDHRRTVAVLRSALKMNLTVDPTNYAIVDDAFEDEHDAMMELVSYSPKTLAEARVRSLYLLSTRFPDARDDEGLAFLRSFTTIGDMAADPESQLV